MSSLAQFTTSPASGVETAGLRQKSLLQRQHSLQQSVLVAKYAKSFPNCVVTNSKVCLEGGSCDEPYYTGEQAIDPATGNRRPDRFAVPCGKKCVMVLPFFAKDAYLYFRTSHLKVFYTDVVLVPLWWIAFVVVVSVSLDALTDPISGTLADQIRSPCGRRRPLMVAGSVLVGILFVLLWTPCAFEGVCPTEEDYLNLQCGDNTFKYAKDSWVYLMVVYVLFFVSLDTFVISIEAFAAELTPSYSDRNCLFGLTMVSSVLGIIYGVVVPPLVGESNLQTQYIWTAVALSAYSIIVCCVAAACLKERGAEKMAEKSKDPARKNASEEADGANAQAIEMTAVPTQAAQCNEADPEVPVDEADIDIEDLAVDLDELAENSGLVAGSISTMRNATFRVLLVSEILESLGDQLQYTIQPFVVKYVIMPVTLTYGTAYALLAGVVLICELASVPFWMFLAQKFGKWKTYLVWNIALSIGTAIKVVAGPEEQRGLWPTILAGALWGMSLGGSRHILRSMVADSIDYDELITGQRREGQYSIFIDFIPKLAEIPSTVVPLLVMATLGYEPNLVPQNDDVYWTILLCFSVAPAFFSLLGALVLLLYPKGARDGSFLDAVQDGIVLHAAGKEALDPVEGKIVFPPQRIQAAIGGVKNDMTMQNFFFYEMEDVVKHKSKDRLTCHAGLWVVLYACLAAVMVGMCVYDWNSNILPILDADIAVCENATHTYENCAGYNTGCTECLPGFWGDECLPCPGMIIDPAGSGQFYVGQACNGFGTCNVTDGTCACDALSGYSGVWCGVNQDNEPFAWFPVYIAVLGVWVFFIAFHTGRLVTACRVSGDSSITVDMISEYYKLAAGRPLTEEEKKTLANTPKAGQQEEQQASMKPSDQQSAESKESSVEPADSQAAPAPAGDEAASPESSAPAASEQEEGAENSEPQESHVEEGSDAAEPAETTTE